MLWIMQPRIVPAPGSAEKVAVKVSAVGTTLFKLTELAEASSEQATTAVDLKPVIVNAFEVAPPP